MRRRGGTKRAIKINKLLRAKNPSKSFYTWEIWEVWRTQSKKKKIHGCNYWWKDIILTNFRHDHVCDQFL